MGCSRNGGGKTYTQPTLNPHVKSIIEVDGYQFIDLNSNGTLDPYEDWRLDADTRTADLVGQMTVREKIAQMQHPTYLPRADGKIPSYLNKWCNKEGIGMLLIRELNSVEAAAVSMNTIQEYAEGLVWACRCWCRWTPCMACLTSPARPLPGIIWRWRQPATKTLSPVWRKLPAMSISPSASA